jgi:hypothetical protein
VSSCPLGLLRSSILTASSEGGATALASSLIGQTTSERRRHGTRSACKNTHGRWKRERRRMRGEVEGVGVCRVSCEPGASVQRQRWRVGRRRTNAGTRALAPWLDALSRCRSISTSICSRPFLLRPATHAFSPTLILGRVVPPATMSAPDGGDKSAAPATFSSFINSAPLSCACPPRLC